MRLLRTKFREKRGLDLTMAEFRTLAYVRMNQDSSLSEAASQIGLGLPSMSKLVDGLVQRQLLTRLAHGSDRRRVCLGITAEGRKALDEGYRHTESFFAARLAELTDDERVQISAALNTLKSLFDLGA
jgi:DNA-binding MarR family transcriptional regulator